MPEGSKTHMGGTMRLGSRETVLQTPDSHAAKLYRPKDNKIHERHRHRYLPLLQLCESGEMAHGLANGYSVHVLP